MTGQRVFEAREHLPQRAWAADSYRVLGRAPTAEAARALIDARLATHPEERGHFTVACITAPEGEPLPPPGQGGLPGA
jgi:hypothetical protein